MLYLCKVTSDTQGMMSHPVISGLLQVQISDQYDHGDDEWAACGKEHNAEWDACDNNHNIDNNDDNESLMVTLVVKGMTMVMTLIMVNTVMIIMLRQPPVSQDF